MYTGLCLVSALSTLLLTVSFIEWPLNSLNMFHLFLCTILKNEVKSGPFWHFRCLNCLVGSTKAGPRRTHRLVVVRAQTSTRKVLPKMHDPQTKTANVTVVNMNYYSEYLSLTYFIYVFLCITCWLDGADETGRGINLAPTHPHPLCWAHFCTRDIHVTAHTSTHQAPSSDATSVWPVSGGDRLPSPLLHSQGLL